MNEYTLKDLIKINNGKDYRHLAEGDIPVYGSGGIMCYVDEYLHDGECILLPRKGTLDNIMYVTGRFWTVDTMYWATVNNELADTRYLYLYLTQLDLSNLDTGSTLPSMTNDTYNMVPVKLPDIDTQHLIADKIFAIREKIANNTDICSDLESMSKLLYDYWFVQFDFPDENGKPYKSSGGKMVWNEKLRRKIPNGWEVKPLSKVLLLLKDGTHNPPNRVVSGIPLLTGTMFGDSFLEYSHATYITDEDYSAIHSHYAPQASDIILTKIGTLGNVNYLRKCDIPIAIHCNSALLRFPDIMAGIFAFEYCRSEEFQKRLRSAKGQSIQEFCSLENIGSVLMVVPSKDVIVKYKNVASCFMQEMEALSEENQQLASLRDFLLPMLMNGQVKVGKDAV